jgi:2'-5' RNA ligase
MWFFLLSAVLWLGPHRWRTPSEATSGTQHKHVIGRVKAASDKSEQLISSYESRLRVYRYFVAVILPEHVKDSLLAALPPEILGMRRITRQEMHLTLHFLGELASSTYKSVEQALASVRIDAFAIKIRGVGAFSAEGLPKVLWAGVENDPALLALHQSISTVLSDAIDFRTEERPYSPHITLARLNSPVARDSIDRYLRENASFDIPPALVTQFAVYSSQIVNDIPRYQTKAVFDLS